MVRSTLISAYSIADELVVEHMVPAAYCLKFLTKLTNICTDCISAFFFNCDRLKNYFYFKSKVNRTDPISPSQDPVSGGLQFRSDIAHLVLVKLFPVCKGPPGFLNRHWEFSETRWQMCHRSYKEVATRHLVSLIYSGQQALMKFIFGCLRGTCLDKQCNC